MTASKMAGGVLLRGLFPLILFGNVDVVEVEADEVESPASKTPKPTGGAKSRKASRGCILVVEDDFDIRAIIADVLRGEGYSVKEAPNGDEGLDLLREGGGIRLVLLDLRMPGMDGWEFRRRQKKEPGIAAIPTVAMSSQRELVRGSECFTAVLSKPFSLNCLLDLVEKLMRCPGEKPSTRRQRR